LPGFGALARPGSIWRMLRNPRRTRAGGQPAGRAGLLPGQPDVGGQAAGEPELSATISVAPSSVLAMPLGKASQDCLPLRLIGRHASRAALAI
jgi:hypothetical protein